MREGWSRREAIGFAGAAALLSTTSLNAQVPVPDATRAWLRRRPQPLPGYDPAPDALRPLVQALEGAQVIGLGEATHGSHEDQACKAAIVRALVTHGNLRAIAFEGNRRAAAALDSCVRGGGDPVATLRESGLFQAWQNEAFVGLLTWLRGWNMSGKPPVRIIGAEPAPVGSEAYEAFHFVQVNAPRFAVNFERPLAPLIGTPEARARSVFEAAQRLTPAQWREARAALDQLQANIASSTRPGAERAAAAAASARRAMDQARAAVGAPASTQQVQAASQGQREQIMAGALIEQLGSDRAVLWGHNLDVMARSSGMVSHLRRRLGERYKALAVEFQQGSFRVKPPAAAGAPADRTPWETVSRASDQSDLGALLGQSGPDHFWLPLTGAEPAPADFVGQPFTHPWSRIESVRAVNSVALTGTDVLVFIRQLTPSRLYPFVPGA